MTIDISDMVTPHLQDAQLRLRDTAKLNRAVAEGVLPEFQRRFRELTATNRNRFGVPGGFWNRMLATLSAGADAQRGWVRMGREVALRYFGGDVVPRSARLLSIPVTAEAYGKRPRDFQDLAFVPTRNGGLLVRRGEKAGKGRAGRKGNTSSAPVAPAAAPARGVYFCLVPKVTIRGDGAVLPSPASIRAAARVSISTFLATTRRTSTP
jgi:hypothetical protein